MEGKPQSRTRDRLLALLWRGPRTVEELAAELGVTSNAVRAQLLALRGEGLVAEAGVRRGARKPSVIYAPTPQAERQLPKPYAAVLTTLLGELSAEGEEPTEELLRRTGASLARAYQPRFANLDEAGKVRELASLLQELGGIVDVERHEDHYFLRGYSCPLAAVVAHQPRACVVIHTLIDALLTGATVCERCQHEGAPRCGYEVDFDGGGDAVSVQAPRQP